VVEVGDDAPVEVVGDAPIRVWATVDTGDVDARELRTDLIVGSIDAAGELREERTVPMESSRIGEDGVCRFDAEFVPGRGGRLGYAIRILPDRAGLHDPFA